jgi:UDP-N-acetylmuramoyl-L-alanyl-D-glutamate--2,6-diaminopimelate ligase
VATLRELALQSDPLHTSGDLDTIVTTMTYDSRQVEASGLFVALPGGYVDGHAFIESALQRGAVAVAAEREIPGVPTLVYRDTRASLPRLAAAFFGHPDRSLNIIGITGTDGKTTTSYLTDAILSHAGKTTGMVGTVSVKVAGSILEHETRQTTPESLDIHRYLANMRDASVEWAILESTSHGLAAHRLDNIQFDIGAVTNITHEHLEFHGTIEAYRNAKASLFERVGASGGTAVINLDDPVSATMVPVATGATILTYSRSASAASIVAEGIRSNERGSHFTLRTESGAADVALPLLGEFNVENALCAAGIALAAGIGLDLVAAGLSSAPAIPGRLTRVDAGQPFSVIVDYAHTPESLEKILKLLRGLSPGKRLICVSGSAGERDTVKRPMQGAVSARLADLSVFTTEDPRFEDAMSIIQEIAAGARSEGKAERSDFVCVVDRQEAIDFAVSQASEGDIVLLAGKGHERSIIWGQDKHPWDEVAAANVALAKLGYGTG